MLVLRLLSKPEPGQKRVWFVVDELASLQRLPQFTTALVEGRKSNNPIIMGFQGKAQLEVIYGHQSTSKPKSQRPGNGSARRSAKWRSSG
jgi:type IV secretory pathway TraG/TraD family ATPase VirD4